MRQIRYIRFAYCIGSFRLELRLGGGAGHFKHPTSIVLLAPAPGRQAGAKARGKPQG